MLMLALVLALEVVLEMQTDVASLGHPVLVAALVVELVVLVVAEQLVRVVDIAVQGCVQLPVPTTLLCET